MKQVFRAHRLCEQDGPLGPYIDSYAAEMRDEGYARQTSEVQIRLVADFGRWLAKRRIQAQEITADVVSAVLRARARRRRPTGNDLSALQPAAGSVGAAGGGFGTGIASGDTGGANCRASFVSTCSRNAHSHRQHRTAT